MRVEVAVCASILAIVVCNDAYAQLTPKQQAPVWWQRTIAEWSDRVIPELESLTSFASKKCPAGKSPEEYQVQKERAGALKVLRSAIFVIRPYDMTKNNLAFYHRHGVALEGRYELTDWPVADTLATLGSRAYPAIYQRMEDHCDELDVRLLAQIFASIDGRELAIQRLKIYEREHPRNPQIPEGEAPLHFNIRKVLDLLEDQEFDKGKYSPTKYYTEVLKKG